MGAAEETFSLEEGTGVGDALDEEALLEDTEERSTLALRAPVEAAERVTLGRGEGGRAWTRRFA